MALPLRLPMHGTQQGLANAIGLRCWIGVGHGAHVGFEVMTCQGPLYTGQRSPSLVGESGSNLCLS